MRIVLKLIVFVVIIVVAGLISLPFIIDPNDYKQQISEQVEKTTGRTLTLEGDIGLSVFPWVALELGPLSLSNSEGFSAEHFAKVSAAEVRIKLMPLLKKQLEMDTVLLDGLVLNLEKNKSGTSNWDDLAKPSDKAEKSTDTPSSDDKAGPALAAISIAGVKLTNANIVWADHSKAEQFELKHLNLETDPLVPGSPTALKLDFDLASAKPQAQAHIKLSSDINVDIENEVYTLSSLAFNTEAEGSDLPLPKITLALNGNIKADMKQQTVDLSQLVIQIHDLFINSNLKVSQLLSDTPQFAGNLDINAFNLRQLAQKLAIELPVMADSSTLELVQVSSQLAGSSNKINLSALDIKLDQSNLTGTLDISEFSDPAIAFKLTLDEIDADRYLPPPPQADTAPTDTNKAAPPAAASAAAASQLPLDTLRGLKISGVLDIAKLKMSGTRSEQVHIEINAKGGVIKLHPMSANLYQGQYQGNVGLDARGKQLKLSINENVKDVQAGPLLNDLSGDDKVSGTVNAQIKLTGRGATADQIKQTLSGNGQFSFTDGALKGINIAESIRKAKAVLKGEVFAETGEVTKTDFSSLTGTFKATNGVINNQDLALMSPLIRVNGAGTADIVQQAIDYGLKVSIVETSTGQDGKDLADLKGVTIPVKITGSFSNPKPSVDLASIAKEKATAELKEKLNEKINDKLGDKLDGELGGLLGGMLGGNPDTPATDDTETQSDEATTEPAATPEDKVKDAIENKLKSFF